jgi:2-methylisocitrate lyase-like PEP mutase family enzyme
MDTMKHSRPTVADKRRDFRSLHESGCFLVPNPWDVGSALYLQSLGFKALATTSAGYAWSQGRRDGGVALEQVLSHFRALVDATDVPINADFEGGFAQGPALITENVRRACDTGVAATPAWQASQSRTRRVIHVSRYTILRLRRRESKRRVTQSIKPAAMSY